jgi:hypothetical protein
MIDTDPFDSCESIDEICAVVYNEEGEEGLRYLQHARLKRLP